MSQEAVTGAELDAEFKAMREIDTALAQVPVDARPRVLRWACEKHRVSLPAGESR